MTFLSIYSIIKNIIVYNLPWSNMKYAALLFLHWVILYKTTQALIPLEMWLELSTPTVPESLKIVVQIWNYKIIESSA